MGNVFTNENFQAEVLDSDIPVMVDFWASWCGPCRMMSPVVEEIGREAEGFKVGKVNVDDEPELARKYNIMAIPTIILFKGGKPAKVLSGFRPKAVLLEMLK